MHSVEFQRKWREASVKERALTRLYNASPPWLANVHEALDRAVWAAYGWPEDEIPGEVEEVVILGRLLALNQERTETDNYDKEG